MEMLTYNVCPNLRQFVWISSHVLSQHYCVKIIKAVHQLDKKREEKAQNRPNAPSMLIGMRMENLSGVC